MEKSTTSVFHDCHIIHYMKCKFRGPPINCKDTVKKETWDWLMRWHKRHDMHSALLDVSKLLAEFDSFSKDDRIIRTLSARLLSNTPFSEGYRPGRLASYLTHVISGEWLDCNTRSIRRGLNPTVTWQLARAKDGGLRKKFKDSGFCTPDEATVDKSSLVRP
jgi:hypothetical protein